MLLARVRGGDKFCFRSERNSCGAASLGLCRTASSLLVFCVGSVSRCGSCGAASLGAASLGPHRTAESSVFLLPVRARQLRRCFCWHLFLLSLPLLASLRKMLRFAKCLYLPLLASQNACHCLCSRHAATASVHAAASTGVAASARATS